MVRPRILIGAILHETNTFNKARTRLSDFEGRYLAFGDAAIRERLAGTATEMSGFIEVAEREGWEACLAVAAAAKLHLRA